MTRCPDRPGIAAWTWPTWQLHHPTAPILVQSFSTAYSQLTYPLAGSTINVPRYRAKSSGSGMLVYLCGAIEYSPDHGKAWRAEITPFLRSLGHDVYDPALDEKKNLTDEEVRDFRNWKSSDLPRFQSTIRKIVDYDLDWVERKCDYIVAYWDEYAGRGAGSQGELTVAYRRGIPVYFVSAVPVEQVSGWILGCASEVFTDFQGLKSRLAVKYATAAAAT